MVHCTNMNKEASHATSSKPTQKKRIGGWLEQSACPFEGDAGVTSYALGYDFDNDADDRFDGCHNHNDSSSKVAKSSRDPLSQENGKQEDVMHSPKMPLPHTSSAYAKRQPDNALMEHNHAVDHLTESHYIRQTSEPTCSSRVDAQSSRTIPLPKSHIPRTQSELQFNEDSVAAEFRDLCMFHRLVNGIQEKSLEQKKLRRLSTEREMIEQQTQASLRRIVRHRCEDLSHLPSRVASTVTLSEEGDHDKSRGDPQVWDIFKDGEKGSCSTVDGECDVFSLDL